MDGRCKQQISGGNNVEEQPVLSTAVDLQLKREESLASLNLYSHQEKHLSYYSP